ncbi:hypothetical protein HMPREF3215_00710 [Staphylococcus simulans]|nr:hypothetical protein HMPREF3215_00710 [Staphylococcus simulans]
MGLPNKACNATISKNGYRTAWLFMSVKQIGLITAFDLGLS